MTAVAVEAVRETPLAPRTMPLRRVTAVELRKMFNTRSGFWLMASIVIGAVIATGAVILFAPDDELTYSTFGTAIGYPMAIILPMVAILSVTAEWSQRSGLTTFTLVPRRGQVIWAKALSAIAVGVASMGIAFAVGAVGNVVGTAITGTPLIWDVSVTDVLLVVFGNVLGLLTGFMLGVLIRNSAGAIVAYFGYSFVLPTISSVLAASQDWYRHAQGWLDASFAQSQLFAFNGNLTGEQWANVLVTTLTWLVLPMAIGLVAVMKSEVK